VPDWFEPPDLTDPNFGDPSTIAEGGQLDPHSNMWMQNFLVRFWYYAVGWTIYIRPHSDPNELV
jgi:hypothetical protein